MPIALTAQTYPVQTGLFPEESGGKLVWFLGTGQGSYSSMMSDKERVIVETTEKHSKKRIESDERMKDIHSFTNRISRRVIDFRYGVKKERTLEGLFALIKQLEEEMQEELISNEGDLYQKYPRSHVAIQTACLQAKSDYFEYLYAVQKEIIQKILVGWKSHFDLEKNKQS